MSDAALVAGVLISFFSMIVYGVFCADATQGWFEARVQSSALRGAFWLGQAVAVTGLAFGLVVLVVLLI